MQVKVYTIAYRDDPRGHVRVEGFDRQCDAVTRYNELLNSIGWEYSDITKASYISAQLPSSYWFNGCFVILTVL